MSFRTELAQGLAMLTLLGLVSFGHMAWDGRPWPWLWQRNLFLLMGGRFSGQPAPAPPDPLIAMLGAENERLHELLALRSRLPGQAHAAVVTRREPETWWTELEVRMAISGPPPRGTAIVMTPQGLIGTLESDDLVVAEEAGQAFCRGRVRLLSSPETQLSVLVGQRQAAFLLEGRGGSELALRPVTSGAEKTISPGDSVRTSGLGELYSKGLQVGQVARDLHMAEFSSLASTPSEVLLWWR